MIINHNLSALNASRQLNINGTNTQKSIEKLSSGLRINRAGDDAAGLAISEKMRGQIRGLDQASRNAEDGISLIQTAEGALSETHSILQRMRELAVQASNDTSTDADRTSIQKEIAQLSSEIDRVANTTQFNTKNLLNGDLTAGQTAQGTKVQSSSMNLKASIVAGTSLTPDSFQIDSSNNTLIVNDGTNDYTVTLGSGSYTAATLATEVQSKIIAANTTAFADVAIAQSGTPAQFTVDNTGASVGATDITIKAGGTANSLLGITGPVADAHTGAASATNFTTTATFNAVAITAATNDTLTFNVDGAGAQSITITAGNYTGANLATQINQQIQLNSNLQGKVSVSYDSTANTLTIQDLTSKNGASSTLAVSGNAATVTGFATNTATVDGTSNALTGLHDSNGDSYGLVAGDTIKISAKIGNTNVSGSLSVTAGTTINDLTTQIASTLGIGASSVSIGSDGSISITGNDGLSNSISDLKLSATDRALFNNEFSNFTETQSAKDTKTNGSITFQIGANANQTVSVGIEKMDTEALGLASVDLSTKQGASNAITMIDNATSTVSTERSKLGAYQNRLEHTINNLGTASENLTSAESRIRDVDMANEMSTYTKNNILAQAAQAMLAQANQQPQQVLQLLR